VRNEPTHDNLVAVLLDYLEVRNNTACSAKLMGPRLIQMGKSVEQLHDLLVEMEDEWEKEQVAIVQLKKSKIVLTFSVLIAVLVGVVLVFAAHYISV